MKDKKLLIIDETLIKQLGLKPTKINGETIAFCSIEQLDGELVNDFVSIY